MFFLMEGVSSLPWMVNQSFNDGSLVSPMKIIDGLNRVSYQYQGLILL